MSYYCENCEDRGEAAEAEIERLRAELVAALSHEGEKDLRIEELLTYLKFDPATGSHRDWVADCQMYEAALGEKHE